MSLVEEDMPIAARAALQGSDDVDLEAEFTRACVMLISTCVAARSLQVCHAFRIERIGPGTG